MLSHELDSNPSSVNCDMHSALRNPEWAWLPKHILDLILDKLVSLYAYIQFGLVCKSWYSVARGNKKKRCIINASHPQLPLLLIPIKDSEERRLYNVVQGKVYDFRVEVPLKRCCGSSNGWLFILEEDKCLTLLNPFSNQAIKLPPITEGEELFSEIFVWKAVLSKDPVLYPNDYEVAVIYDGMRRLALYRAQYETWTYFSDNGGLKIFMDVIYYKGSFYAIDYWMGIGRIDNTSIENSVSWPQVNLVLRRILPTFPEKQNVYDTFLVETSDGDLLLVRRYLFKEDYEWTPDLELEETGNDFTIKFRVYKLGELSNNGPPNLVEINDLGDYAMFLGCNHSTLVSTLEFPGLQRNCIYYTNDRVDVYNPLDAGIFKLGDGEIRPHYIPENDEDLPPTNWIVPTLQGDWHEGTAFL
ncbi:hypothetical protein SLA2020_156050 [Shorea laevis]